MIEAHHYSFLMFTWIRAFLMLLFNIQILALYREIYDFCLISILYICPNPEFNIWIGITSNSVGFLSIIGYVYSWQQDWKLFATF